MTEKKHKGKSAMLPLLRGMFICPDAIKSYAGSISDFSFTEFFEWADSAGSESRFHKLMHKKSKSQMMEDPDPDLFVF